MAIRIVLVIIRLVIGGLFIYSGWSKISPIEPLEFAVVEYTHLPWLLGAIAARLLIAIELVLGVCMIFSLKSRLTSKLTGLVLSVFSIYLIFILLTEGNEGNCGCFGVKHEMTPLEGLFKNICTLVLLGVYYKLNNYSLSVKRVRLIILGIVCLGISLPYILNPIYVSKEDKYVDFVGKSLQLDSIGIVSYQDQKINLTEGKYLVTFFSMACPHCKMSSQKINIIANRVNVDVRRFYFFGKRKEKLPNYEEDLKVFWEKTKSDVVPNKVLVKELFFKHAGVELPAMFLVEDGIIKKKIDYNMLNDDLIIEFFQK